MWPFFAVHNYRGVLLGFFLSSPTVALAFGQIPTSCKLFQGNVWRSASLWSSPNLSLVFLFLALFEVLYAHSSCAPCQFKDTWASQDPTTLFWMRTTPTKSALWKLRAYLWNSVNTSKQILMSCDGHDSVKNCRGLSWLLSVLPVTYCRSLFVVRELSSRLCFICLHQD